MMPKPDACSLQLINTALCWLASRELTTVNPQAPGHNYEILKRPKVRTVRPVYYTEFRVVHLEKGNYHRVSSGNIVSKRLEKGVASACTLLEIVLTDDARM